MLFRIRADTTDHSAAVEDSANHLSKLSSLEPGHPKSISTQVGVFTHLDTYLQCTSYLGK
ncbi:hypothetical protein LZ31DRAFT_328584 [Colletotrichum somersetense]|nr:hypothetical protein LZ31DRAFT_328584 [Colletotrichum somersetense]